MIKKYIENYAKSSIIVAVLMMIVAIYLIAKPLDSMEAIHCIFGGILAISGAVSMISYFRKRGIHRLTSFDLLFGFGSLLMAVMIIVYRKSLMYYMPIIIGIWIVFSGLVGLQMAINLCFAQRQGWLILMLLSILQLIIGIVQINDPVIGILSSMTIAGICLLINEICALVNAIMLLNTMKKIKTVEVIEDESSPE